MARRSLIEHIARYSVAVHTQCGSAGEVLCGGLPSNAKKASVPGKAAVTVDGFRSSLLGSSRGRP